MPTPSLAADLPFGSIHALRDALVARRISALEAVDAVFARIERDEPKLAAWVELDRECARRAARTVDLALPLGGVPFGAKDVIDVRGLPTRYGVNLPASPAPFDAWCVAVVRRAGAIPLGKLHTTAFASSDPAPTRNPWDLSRTPGGSSSGSGAAVGARQIPFAFGTQTGGSTLRPAAFNGVVGFKPTWGTIPTAGVSMFAPSFDTVGIICRDAADAELLFGLYAPATVPAAEPSAPTLLDALDFRPDVSGPAVIATVSAALETLRAAGARAAREPLPASVGGCESGWLTMVEYEANAALAAVIEEHPAPPLVSRVVRDGSGVDFAAYRDARAAMLRMRDDFDALLARYDAVVMPAAGQVPGPQTTGSAAFLRPWTTMGNPSIAIPVGFDDDGLPIGMQLIAKRGDDARLLALARWAQHTLGFEHDGPRARLDAARVP